MKIFIQTQVAKACVFNLYQLNSHFEYKIIYPCSQILTLELIKLNSLHQIHAANKVQHKKHLPLWISQIQEALAHNNVVSEIEQIQLCHYKILPSIYPRINTGPCMLHDLNKITRWPRSIVVLFFQYKIIVLMKINCG